MIIYCFIIKYNYIIYVISSAHFLCRDFYNVLFCLSTIIVDFIFIVLIYDHKL